MNDKAQCLMRAITGPVILITVGVLFTIDALRVSASARHGRCC